LHFARKNLQVQATYKDIWRIAYPITIGSLAQTILGITNTAFLARVGEMELGSSTIGNVFYFVLVMVGMGFGIGSQILMARKAGENNPQAIGKIFDHSIILLVVLSLLIFGLVSFFSHGILSLIIKSPHIQVGAGEFLKYRIWGIFFAMSAMAFRAFYVGISQTRIITYSAIVMAVLNVVLDYVLIFGHFGFPKMGLAGAGLASAISEAAAAGYLVVYTIFKRDIKNFRLFKFDDINETMFSRVVRLSAPVVLQNLISMGSWFAFFVFIERLGEHELAISNVVRSSYMIMMTPVWGYSSAANSMVSNLIGQDRAADVIGLLKKIVKLSAITSLAIALFSVVFGRFMLQLVASGDKLVNDSMYSFYIATLATFVFSISVILFSGVSGTGATRAAMFLEITNIAIYLSYVFVCAVLIGTPVEVVWISEVLYWFMMGTFSYYYLKSKRWVYISV